VPHATLGVVAHLLDAAAVDDVRDLLDGDRRLGDVGRDDDLDDACPSPLKSPD